MAAYMRDQFAFFGIPTRERRALIRAALADLPRPTERELTMTAKKCWAQPQREFQYFACEYVRRNSKRCSPEFLSTIEWLVTRKSWWDTVDDLAHSTGALVIAHPQLIHVMDNWIEADNFWIARVALIHQLAYKERTDTARLFDYCTRRATDSEFFIRKAIGWALRQYAWTDPVAVQCYVDATPSLSPLSRREALKNLR